MIDNIVRAFEGGGFYMWPILALLIFSLIIFIERFYVLYIENREDKTALLTGLNNYIMKGDLHGAIRLVLAIVLGANAFLLSLFSLSCNSCRHISGGYLNSFHSAPGKYQAWSFISRLNEKHMEYAWVSLIWVALADFYVRLLSMGVISDLRFF